VDSDPHYTKLRKKKGRTTLRYPSSFLQRRCTHCPATSCHTSHVPRSTQKPGLKKKKLAQNNRLQSQMGLPIYLFLSFCLRCFLVLSLFLTTSFDVGTTFPLLVIPACILTNIPRDHRSVSLCSTAQRKVDSFTAAILSIQHCSSLFLG
jgi:hypothetical protein